MESLLIRGEKNLHVFLSVVRVHACKFEGYTQQNSPKKNFIVISTIKESEEETKQ